MAFGAKRAATVLVTVDVEDHLHGDVLASAEIGSTGGRCQARLGLELHTACCLTKEAAAAQTTVLGTWYSSWSHQRENGHERGDGENVTDSGEKGEQTICPQIYAPSFLFCGP